MAKRKAELVVEEAEQPVEVPVEDVDDASSRALYLYALIRGYIAKPNAVYDTEYKLIERTLTLFRDRVRSMGASNVVASIETSLHMLHASSQRGYMGACIDLDKAIRNLGYVPKAEAHVEKPKPKRAVTFK